MIPDMVQAIHMLDKSTLQNATVQVMTTYTPSPVALCAQSCEALYADACFSNSTASADAKTLCYQLADYCVQNAWWEIGQTARGPGMCAEMRRQLGDPSCTATEADRPAVSSDYTLEPRAPAVMANSATS
jgi:hypothetical protein